MLQVDLCHNMLLRSQKPLLSYEENNDFDTWKAQVREKLILLLGDMPAERCDLQIRIEWEKEWDSFTEKRIIFRSEEYVDIPCHLWIPKNTQKPCPVAICLQGHTTGMHISMGRTIYPQDEAFVSSGDRDLAVQAVKNGYAALSMELRGFGELRSEAHMKMIPQATVSCEYSAGSANLLGRTLIGERVWDISRAVDLLETFPEIDSEKILLTGNSGGGTVSYYTACIEPRIAMVLPSSSVCAFGHSIIGKRHCSCNYIPGIAKYLDMGDLACLIAPRPLVIVAGIKDHGFSIEGSRAAAEVARKIYARVGAENCFRFLEGPEGHRYYADLSWPVVHSFFD